MSTLRKILNAALAAALLIVPAAAGVFAAPRVETEETSTQQQPYGALERGWRTGYSDGYQTGWRDVVDRRESDYQNKDEYRRADRAHVAAYGPVEQYRDGYRQGFELGYADGYARRGFNSELPAGGVRARGDVAESVETTEARPSSGTVREADPADDNYTRDAGRTSASAAGSIPPNTILRVELLNRLSTDVSQRGDRFEARVIEPREYEGAVVSGKVAEVGRAGKVNGRAQLQLDFDQIRLASGEWADFSAQVIEVINTGGSDETGEVDPEGGVRGRSSTKDDVKKVGVSTGIGAIIGAIAGGGKGAVIGAVIGAGVGTGGVMTQRGKDIRFERGQQLRLRTSGR
ncbi:MAG TPA: hypothetical protein VF240_10110 [Pyrinomonadaceae bacterium]